MVGEMMMIGIECEASFRLSLELVQVKSSCK